MNTQFHFIPLMIVFDCVAQWTMDEEMESEL